MKTEMEMVVMMGNSYDEGFAGGGEDQAGRCGEKRGEDEEGRLSRSKKVRWRMRKV
jgi:hypothetical protein